MREASTSKMWKKGRIRFWISEKKEKSNHKVVTGDVWILFVQFVQETLAVLGKQSNGLLVVHNRVHQRLVLLNEWWLPFLLRVLAKQYEIRTCSKKRNVWFVNLRTKRRYLSIRSMSMPPHSRIIVFQKQTMYIQESSSERNSNNYVQTGYFCVPSHSTRLLILPAPTVCQTSRRCRTNPSTASSFQAPCMFGF